MFDLHVHFHKMSFEKKNQRQTIMTLEPTSKKGTQKPNQHVTTNIHTYIRSIYVYRNKCMNGYHCWLFGWHLNENYKMCF